MGNGIDFAEFNRQNAARKGRFVDLIMRDVDDLEGENVPDEIQFDQVKAIATGSDDAPRDSTSAAAVASLAFPTATRPTNSPPAAAVPAANPTAPDRDRGESR